MAEQVTITTTYKTSDVFVDAYRQAALEHDAQKVALRVDRDRAIRATHDCSDMIVEAVKCEREAWCIYQDLVHDECLKILKAEGIDIKRFFDVETMGSGRYIQITYTKAVDGEDWKGGQ